MDKGSVMERWMAAVSGLLFSAYSFVYMKFIDPSGDGPNIQKKLGS